MRKMDRRRLSRGFLSAIPEFLRFRLMRRMVRLNPAWPSDSLEIKIADSEEELESAYHLLHDSYVDAGFMNPHPSGMRILPQHLLPQCTTIVAKWDKRVIGTLSLIRDNPFGLPLEKIFDVSEHRKGGRRLAEISSLAVDPAYRHNVNKALFPLFRFVYQYAWNFFGTHELVIAVNPSMVDLYLAFMCFEKLEKATKTYDFVNGAKAVGLFLDLENIQGKLEVTFGHRPVEQNFFHYWTTIPNEPKNRLPGRKFLASVDPVVTPRLLKSLFMEKGMLWKLLTPNAIEILRGLYPQSKYQEIFDQLRECHSFHPRKELRADVQMPGKWNAQIVGEVLNVSRGGLQIKTDCSFSVGQILDLQVQMKYDHWTSIKVRILWTQPGVVGAQVLVSSSEWTQMNQALEREFEILAA